MSTEKMKYEEGRKEYPCQVYFHGVQCEGQAQLDDDYYLFICPSCEASWDLYGKPVDRPKDKRG